MKLEDQVCSLELAKRLKKLGVNQDSLFYWLKADEPYVWYNGVNYPMEVTKWCFSAFTVAELFESLPTSFEWESKDGKSSSENVYLRVVKYNEEYQVDYFDHDDKWFSWAIEFDKKLPNALAKMRIFLLENGLIKSE